MLKQVSHLKILIQAKGYPSYFFFVVIFNFFKLGKLFLFLGALDLRFLWGIREVRTGISHVSLSSALETKPLFETFFSLSQSKFLDPHCVDIHGIGVFSGFGGRGE